MIRPSCVRAYACSPSRRRRGGRAKALMRTVTGSFTKIVDKSDTYPQEIKGIIATLNEPGRLADFISANLELELDDKQKALEIIDPLKRLEFIYSLLSDELEIAKIGEKIKSDVRREMDREQRDYYLRQQIKAIQKELGEEDVTVEQDDLKQRIEQTDMPEHVSKAAMKELGRLMRMSTSSAEYSKSSGSFW